MPVLDLSNYTGREQAYVKHCLLEKYLAPLAYKVGSAWDSIVYLDGFAGPWEVKHPDLADSSFGIAIETLKRAQVGLREKNLNVRMKAILVEHDQQAFAKLQAYGAAQNTADFDVHTLRGEFVEQIPEVQRITRLKCQNPFRFVFLDPKGWAQIPMKELQPLLKDRSCEVLINLMTRHIIRFLDESNRAESYQSLFGRAGVLEKLREAQKGGDERAEQAVREYCRSLKELCCFKYVSSAVILEPDQESVRYFLVYGTNDFHGVEVFKQAEITAARIQDAVRHEVRVQKTRQEEMMFESAPPKSRVVQKLRDRYIALGRSMVLRTLKDQKSGFTINYEELFCLAMSFPLVTPDDLIGWLAGWEPHLKLQLAGATRRKKPSPDQEDVVVVVNREMLQ